MPHSFSTKSCFALLKLLKLLQCSADTAAQNHTSDMKVTVW